ncbi:retrovirus-related pol polyprotein from transposon TNT 1-94 [Tanacetum coccineum]
MGNSKKKPHKPKSKDTNQEILYILHMDLCGTMCVTSVNGKKYILVIVDDYSRFTWVKFLKRSKRMKLKISIIQVSKMIQVLLKVLGPIPIRTDNGTEFVNQTLREYYEKVGISHETSVARSSQQNGVVEIRNPKPSFFQPFVPPRWKGLDLLFQPLFDELLTPPPSVDYPTPKVVAPIHEVVATVHTDHPLENIIGELDRPVSTRLQLHEQALFCYYDAFLTAVEPKTYKDALTQSCWIEVMQEELNEFERLRVWELVLRPDKVMVITLKWIYKVKLDDSLEAIRIFLAFAAYMNMVVYQMDVKIAFLNDFSKGSVDPTLFIHRQGKGLLLKYGFDSCDPVDTAMVEKSKLDKNKELKAVDPSHYLGMIGTLFYLTASRHDQYACVPSIRLVLPKSTYMRLKGSFDADHAGCQDIRHSTYGSVQFLGDRLVSWSEAYRTSDFHIIKEHVENGGDLNFICQYEYQLAENIIHKSPCYRKNNFYITTGNASLRLRTLKQLRR